MYSMSVRVPIQAMSPHIRLYFFDPLSLSYPVFCAVYLIVDSNPSRSRFVMANSFLSSVEIYQNQMLITIFHQMANADKLSARSQRLIQYIH